MKAQKYSVPSLTSLAKLGDSATSHSLQNDSASLISQSERTQQHFGKLNVGGNSLNIIVEDGNEQRVNIRRSKNDVRDIRSLRQLDRLELSLDSPRFKEACENLGIAVTECIKR